MEDQYIENRNSTVKGLYDRMMVAKKNYEELQEKYNSPLSSVDDLINMLQARYTFKLAESALDTFIPSLSR